MGLLCGWVSRCCRGAGSCIVCCGRFEVGRVLLAVMLVVSGVANEGRWSLIVCRRFVAVRGETHCVQVSFNFWAGREDRVVRSVTNGGQEESTKERFAIPWDSKDKQICRC